jgi:putative sterol carrier protein
LDIKNAMKKRQIITVGEMSQAILHSGYLLEQRVEGVLEKAGYYVETNAAYPDPITGKSREIDIEAITGFRISKDYDFIFVRLICECENNQKPVVFFIKKSPISFLHHEEVKAAGIPVQFLEKRISTKHGYKFKSSGSYIGLPDFLRFEKYHHYCKGPISTQYCTFTRKNENSPWVAFHSDSQHDSLTSLIFALEAEIDEYYKSYVVPSKNETEYINMEIYYPLLVLQGPLYSAEIKNKKLELKTCNHIQYRKDYFSKDKHDTYQIDVITESFLPKFLKIIEGEMEKAKKILKRKIKIVRESIEILTERARKKKKSEPFREIFEF